MDPVFHVSCKTDSFERASKVSGLHPDSFSRIRSRTAWTRWFSVNPLLRKVQRAELQIIVIYDRRLLSKNFFQKTACLFQRITRFFVFSRYS